MTAKTDHSSALPSTEPGANMRQVLTTIRDVANQIGARGLIDLSDDLRIAASMLDAAPDLYEALAPSDGGTADFASELEVIASIIESRDAGSGLHLHIQARAAKIRAALGRASADI